MRVIKMLGLAFALSTAIGCSGSNGNNGGGKPDLSGGGSNADMATGPTCFSGTPATDTDFLNSCTTDDNVDVTPFYPTNAPNGQLPALP